MKLVLGRVTLEGGSQYRDGLHLIAVNHGNVPVQVVSAGIYLPDGAPYPEDSPYNAYPERGDDFSLPIKPGNNKAVTLQGLKLRAFCDSLVNAEHNSTVSLVGFYEDGTLKVHKSDSFHFNIEDAMKLARSQSDA
ncbi:MAG: hypothetical protein GTN69_08470, partial [Armatimonadetes bacterium]|nr:hypothetical protein [Gemmatimonadales bacterium]NIO75897.1 hypothetical protein [Armatimonadota bacterium]